MAHACAVKNLYSLFFCQQCQVVFLDSHGVCVVREQASRASIKKGVDFFSPPHLPMHAYICSLTYLMHIHYPSHSHTHIHNDQSQPLPACLSYLGHFEKQAVWMMNLLWQSACVSMPLHQNYTSAMFACVFVCMYMSLHCLFTDPIQGCRRKALANILIHS